MSAPIKLAARLDMAAAQQLKDTLLSQDDGDLELDASELTHLGGLSFQVILAAIQRATSTGHALKITSASDEMREAFLLLGLPKDNLMGEQI